MLAFVGCEGSREQGFTMVELVVALSVLAIGVVGVVGVMNSTFGIAVGNNDRSRAVAVATRELESLRSTPWDQLVPSADTSPRQVQVGGKTYEVERAVTTAPTGKQATVVVRWDAGGGRVSDLHQTTTIYPGGLAGVTSTTVAPSMAGLLTAPTALVASLPTEVSGGTNVDLVWTNPVPANPLGSYLVVEWSVDGFTGSSTRLTERLSSTVNRVRVPGLSAGTTYGFRVAAVSPSGEMSAWSPVASITTAAAAASAPCTYGTVSVTPSHVRRHADRLTRLAVPVSVSVNTSGTCAGLHLVYEPNRTSGAQSWLLAPAAGGVWTATLPELVGVQWSIGVHAITVRDLAETVQATAFLTVCDHGAVAC